MCTVCSCLNCTNSLLIQVYQVKRGERHYPVRERAANSRLEKLCTKGYFDCKSICIYAHWPEEQMYWKGILDSWTWTWLPNFRTCPLCTLSAFQFKFSFIYPHNVSLSFPTATTAACHSAHMHTMLLFFSYVPCMYVIVWMKPGQIWVTQKSLSCVLHAVP